MFYCIVLYCIVLYCIVLYCIVLYCIVLYFIVLYFIVLYCTDCIVLYCRLLNVSFYKSEYTLIKNNMKQIQGLHKTVHLLQNEHAHLFSRNQVLHKTVHLLQNEHAHLFSRNQVFIKFLICLVFCAVFIDSGSEFQILGP